MIGITGATGQLGAGVIASLIQKGANPSDLVALARSTEKAQALSEQGVNIRIGDYNDYDSLLAAFEGVSKLLLISSNDLENREKQQLSVIRAAKEAGVQHVLYTSIQRQSDASDSTLAFVANSHIATEQAMANSGMKYTFLRNNLYMDIMPWILGEQVFDTGVFYPAQEGKIAFALRSEMAEAAATVLLGEGHENTACNISNPHSMAFSEVAEHLSTLAGKPVQYVSPPVETYKSTLLGAGVPETAIEFLAGFAVAAASGELVAGESDLPKLLGREPASYIDFLNGLYGQTNS